MSKTSIHDPEAVGGDTDRSPDNRSKVQNDTETKSSPVNEELRMKLNDRLIISNEGDANKEMHDATSPDSNNDQGELPRQVSVDGSASQVKVPTSSIAGSEVTALRTIGAVKSGGGGGIMPKRHSGISDRSSGGSLVAKDQWGWFEDVHEGETDGDDKEEMDDGNHNKSDDNSQLCHGTEAKSKKLLFHDVDRVEEVVPKRVEQEGTMIAVTAPTYVLEESRSSQKLWKQTAGTRPPQPVEERAFFERIWAQNFQRSQVDYKIPAEVLTATSPVALNPFADADYDTGSFLGQSDVQQSESDAISSIVSKNDRSGFYGNPARSRNLDYFGPYDHQHTLVNKKVKDDGTDDELTVVVRGDNVFGTTVSKSFPKKNSQKVVTVSISVASYRVVESKKHGKYAQFLVIFCEGSFTDTVGVWKRYSDFDKLSRWVTKGHESCTSALAGMNPLAITEDVHDHEVLPNAVTSWKLLKKRQRWFRCLDAGYLSLKAFLLERFLHDILFESSTPNILREFVGVDEVKKK
eukprot:CAMPEP_0176500312 /NCGR_PEP_ID=MMETSP0200_2-20121128/13460_1 /TAXON_ID=947934 /ORGANISM="Chaetoceros sp., Strain GSL56" /LENGTH=519 /DNA_ID=CAMNT_0017898923 /DNA_START=211 /DNA_END=1770 /DNA_ORIENTATION=-